MYDVWVGDVSFKVKFNRLFRLSVQREALVNNCGSWGQNGWKCGLMWSRELKCLYIMSCLSVLTG